MGQLKISQLPSGTTVTGSEFIPVIQNGKTVKIPAGQLGGNSGSILYKAAPSLTQADIGKIVSWSKDGACIGIPSGGQQGALGQWLFDVSALPALPKSREIRFDFSMATVNDGDTISFSHPNFGSSNYTFRSEATQWNESAIGSTPAETASNLVNKIQQSGGPMNSGAFFISQKDNDATFTVGMYSQYSSHFWVGSQSELLYSFTTPGITTTENSWADGCMAFTYDFKDTYLFSGNLNISFAEIFSKDRSNGYEFGGYRFPESIQQYRSNIREACYNKSYALQWADLGDSQLQITQTNLNNPPPDMVYAYLDNTPFGKFKFTIQQQPLTARPNLVPGHVLGKLVSVSDGKAAVDMANTVKVKLVEGIVSFNPNNLKMLYPNRLGILHQNGGVIPAASHPDTKLIFNGDDFLNGIQFFEFLEEGNVGNEVYARIIPFIGGK